jgi:uncharacterized protein
MPLAALVTMLLAGAPAAGASFDCARAADDVERRICSDPRLSRLDAELAQVLRARLRTFRAGDPTGEAADLRDRQRAWMAEDRDRCETAECVERAYLVRIAGLRSGDGLDRRPLSREEPSGSIFGTYVREHEECWLEMPSRAARSTAATTRIGSGSAAVRIEACSSTPPSSAGAAATHARWGT